MKIYISADIEGISGVVNTTQTSIEGHDYYRARKLMTAEVNAAILGAKLAGATEIVVNDSHGPMTNLLIENLDEEATLITGNQKLQGMMEGINDTFDAALLIGYHSGQNTAGVLSHSYDSKVISEIKLNGKVVGELEFNSMIAGYYNIPIVFVSGDDMVSSQAKSLNPNIETVTVKYAHSRYTAECLSPAKVHNLLKETVYTTLVNKLNAIKPCKIENPVELELTFMNSGMAEIALFVPNVEMIRPNSIRYTAKNIIEAYQVRFALTTLAGSTL